MFNVTFKNISVISWWSVLLVEEIEFLKKTTDLSQVTEKLYHLMLYLFVIERFIVYLQMKIEYRTWNNKFIIFIPACVRICNRNATVYIHIGIFAERKTPKYIWFKSVDILKIKMFVLISVWTRIYILYYINPLFEHTTLY